MPLPRLLLPKTLLLPVTRMELEPVVPPPCPMAGAPTSLGSTARVGLSVLPVVNAGKLDAVVVSGRNGMLSNWWRRW
jgi:hypothetical protein